MKQQHPVNWFDVWKDNPKRSFVKWIVAIVVSLFFNWFYILGIPGSQPAEAIALVEEEKPEEFLIELSEEEDELPEYVETNPEKVENEPDETNNISDRDQQAAQENVKGPDANDAPFIEGDDPESMKLLEGAMPREGAPSAAIETYSSQSEQQPTPTEQQSSPSPESPQVVREGQDTQSPDSLPIEQFKEELPTIPKPPPTPEFIDPEEPSDDPEGTKLTIIEDDDQEDAMIVHEASEDKVLNINIPPSVAEQMAIAIEAQKAKEAQQTQQQPQPRNPQRPRPAPRPRLDPNVLPGPVLDSQTYAARMDPVGFDAKFSQFGHYLSRMFEAIQLQWYSLLYDINIGQEKRPALVVIRYTINTEGKVIDAEVLETNAGQLATLLCQDAIESRAPYGPWTEQMIDQLGEQQDIVLRFIYL